MRVKAVFRAGAPKWRNPILAQQRRFAKASLGHRGARGDKVVSNFCWDDRVTLVEWM